MKYIHEFQFEKKKEQKKRKKHDVELWQFSAISFFGEIF